MAKYRDQLPQLSGGLFLTDGGGIETTLIFLDGLELPYFAAFDLLKDDAGREALRKYFRSHASIARAHKMGFILESPTWRASSDWGAKLGYSLVASPRSTAAQSIQCLNCVTSLRRRHADSDQRLRGSARRWIRSWSG
jgi:hypothetical protein